MFWHRNNKTPKDHPSFTDRERGFVCTMHGPFELFIENYGSLGDYDENHIVLKTWKSTLIIEGQKSTRDSLYSSESREAKECIARGHRSINLTQGFNLNVCENTGRFQTWSFNNLRNYAVNRGDKGILRYMFGIGTRGMIATAGTAVNISTNLIKNVVDMFKYASS